MMKLSIFFSWFLKINLLIIAFLATIGWGHAEEALLGWDANTEADLGGYKVYVGTASLTYDPPIDVGNQTSYTVTGLGTGTYYFSVTAYDTSGNESSFSNEVTKTFADITPPVISSIAITNIDSSSAVISWSTDEGATSQVDYGTTTSYGSSTQISTGLTTSHSQTLNNLNPSTTYHFRLVSQDGTGNVAISGNNTFTTTDPPDTTPPAISNVSTLNISSTSATVTWMTNESSTTQIEYGTSVSYGSMTNLNNSLLVSHSQNLNGLIPSTTYHFRVLSTDIAGNLATSTDNTFTTLPTPDTTPPIISSIGEDSLTSTGIIISWNTDEGATSQVEYGTTTAYGSNSPLNATLVISHSRDLSGLSPSTTYHYRVMSTDAAGNQALSGDNTFTTSQPPDTIPPAISGITTSNITSSSAVVNWSTNEQATSQVEYGLSTAYGLTSNLDSTLKTNHTVSLSELSPSTTYHFRIRTMDALGNLSVSNGGTFNTLPAPDQTPPVISSIETTSLTPSTILINWVTNESATSQVEYGETTAYENTTLLNATLVRDHSLTLTSLTPGTTYHFRVRSLDAAGNLSVSPDQIMQTPNTPDQVPPGQITTFSGLGQDREILLSWITPSDTDYVGTRIVFKTTGGYPDDVNDGALLGDFTGVPSEVQSTSHSELQNGTTYYYAAFPYDGQGNYQPTPGKVEAIPQPGTEGTNVPLSGGSGLSDLGNAGGCGFVKDAGQNQNRKADIAMFIVPFLIGLRLLFQRVRGKKLLQYSFIGGYR